MEIDYDFPSKFDDQYSLLSRKLIRLLSEDARTSILELSAKLGISRRTVRERIQRLEQDFKMRCTVEFNENMLGLTSPHLIVVKFMNKPNYNEVQKVLASSHIPQLAVTIKGKFDLLIYANAVTSDQYVHWDKRTQIQLSKYGIRWHSSDVAHKQLGYFPIRNELIDKLNLDPEHKAILKLLNFDSRMTFSDMSRSMNMHFNTVSYNFNKLLHKGYIKRFTISAEPPKNLTLMSMFSKYMLSEGYENDAARIRKVFAMSGNEYPILNRYQVCAQLVGSYDFFNLSIFDNYNTAYKNAVLGYRDNFKRQKTTLEYGVVDRVLIGRLPLRSIDAKKEYNIIKWTTDPIPE